MSHSPHYVRRRRKCLSSQHLCGCSGWVSFRIPTARVAVRLLRRCTWAGRHMLLTDQGEGTPPLAELSSPRHVLRRSPSDYSRSRPSLPRRVHTSRWQPRIPWRQQDHWEATSRRKASSEATEAGRGMRSARRSVVRASTLKLSPMTTLNQRSRSITTRYIFSSWVSAM